MIVEPRKAENGLRHLETHFEAQVIDYAMPVAT